MKITKEKHHNEKRILKEEIGKKNGIGRRNRGERGW